MGFSKQQEAYFRTLPLARQLKMVEDTWGVMPSVSLDATIHPRQGVIAVCSVALLSPLLRAELMDPLPVVFARRVTGPYSPSQHIADTLLRWCEGVEEHMNSKSL